MQKNIRTILSLLAVIFLLGMTACKKDNNEGGPSIGRVRANLPAPNDSTLSKAGPGEWIVIEGSGFTTTQALFFNGWPADFNATLFSDNSMVVLIPGDMPFASLDQSQLNTIKVVTSYGETTYTFAIEPPPPVITSMTNEMALANETVTIYGNNFFFIDKVIFPDDVEVTSGIVTNESGTTLTLQVPAGITSAGTIKVVNRYGTGESVLRFNDLVTGMINNYDNVNNFEWGAGSSSSSADFPGNRGTFGVMTATGISGGDMGWWNGSRSINTVSAPWVPVADLGKSVNDYAMKFELNVRKPWSAGSIFIVKDYNWGYLARFEPWLGSGGSFTTNNHWVTIVIPLANFKAPANGMDGTGASAPSLSTLLGGGGAGNSNMLFVNPGTTTVAEFEAAIDNVRIVRITK